jgi:predicted DNA binding CopG/RHH family protein
MSNFSSSETYNDSDDYPEVTQSDLDRSKFRIGLKTMPKKQAVTISLDVSLIEYFKSKAGESGYQHLITDVTWKKKGVE